MDKVVKTTVFLKDMNDFVAMNEVYATVSILIFIRQLETSNVILLLQFFSDHQPARSAVQVARLPKDVAVEIECVAVTK